MKFSDLKSIWKKKTEEDLRSPETIPSGGGRRLTGAPLAILGAIGVTTAVVIGYVAYDRTEQQQVKAAAQETPEKSAPAMAFAKELTEQTHNRFTPAAKTKPEPVVEKKAEVTPKSEAPAVAIRREVAPRRLSPEMERIRGEKARHLEAALKARLSVAGQSIPSATRRATAYASEADPALQQAVASGDPTAVYQAKLARIKSGLPADGTSSRVGVGSSFALGGSKGKDFGQFDRQNRWTLNNELETPASPFLVRAGFVIPAIMISGINSDLPGQVMAQVSQNVYDSATGRSLLIPQGTRLVGSYASDVSYGQNRVMMAWQRLVFPDGKTLDIEAMPGADQAGYAGFKDKVDNHYFRIFGSAILLSGVIAGVSLSQDNDNDNSDNQRAGDALSEALGQTLGNAMAQMLQKNLNISPTLQIRPGYRFNVMVTKDLKLPGEYRAFDY